MALEAAVRWCALADNPPTDDSDAGLPREGTLVTFASNDFQQPLGLSLSWRSDW